MHRVMVLGADVNGALRVRGDCPLVDLERTLFFFFFLNDRAPPEISPLPLPAALPICRRDRRPPPCWTPHRRGHRLLVERHAHRTPDLRPDPRSHRRLRGVLARPDGGRAGRGRHPATPLAARAARLTPAMAD